MPFAELLGLLDERNVSVRLLLDHSSGRPEHKRVERRHGEFVETYTDAYFDLVRDLNNSLKTLFEYDLRVSLLQDRLPRPILPVPSRFRS